MRTLCYFINNFIILKYFISFVIYFIIYNNISLQHNFAIEWPFDHCCCPSKNMFTTCKRYISVCWYAFWQKNNVGVRGRAKRWKWEWEERKRERERKCSLYCSRIIIHICHLTAAFEFNYFINNAILIFISYFVTNNKCKV